MANFNQLKTRNELADFLEIPRKQLTYILYKKGVNSYYKTFEIPKKSGGNRIINAPTGSLAFVQSKLLDRLIEFQDDLSKNGKKVSNISHGFEKGRNIMTNSKVHKNKKYVLNLDLEDFFDSFHFGRVRGYFEKNKNFSLPLEVSTVIAQLTCFNGALPQGACTSPIITNMICEIFDFRILKLAKKYKLDYTRYADDLTFSTNDKCFMDVYDEFIESVRTEIEKSGFKINDKKTRLQCSGSKQVVTGLVVNKKVNIDRRYFRNTKAMALSLYTKGEFFINGGEGTLSQLEGRFSFINQIDYYNNNLYKKNIDIKYSERCKNLNGREREYRKFLFYKYFYNNSKPLIITEGKTDVRYIKAALKNLYLEYPKLIEKKDNGKFEFKITFLNRTKRLRYLFGLSLDGADAMSTLYYYFVETRNNDFPNYFKYFYKLNPDFCSPVIFLFDNEMKSKYPLQKFVNMHKISNEKVEVLKNDCLVKLDDTNVYLLVNPLRDGDEMGAIESLFTDEVLQHEINNKKFDSSNNYDSSISYGKDELSKYVYSNYENIDFSNFIPMLNNISNIIL